MQDRLKQIFRATIISIIVALLFVIIVLAAIRLTAENKISMAISLINSMSAKTAENNNKPVLDTEKKSLESYPSIGEKYGTIEIDSINLKLPIYFGDSIANLKIGVGHYSGSYFPGEGGSIIYAAHNTAKFFRKLPEVKDGDVIKITTDYGEFNYKVYKTQVIYHTEYDKLPIQDEKEILMAYTCYPVTGIGHKTHRFVVYAELMEE